MRYKGKNQPHTRELRRLWEVEIYDGDPDKKKTKIKKETVVAWNAVDAIRACGNRKLAKEPEALCYVTWPDEDGMPIYKIKDTSGPTKEEIKPTIETRKSD